SIAGSSAAFAIRQLSTPANSIIRNAAAPIIGGIICPPVDAAAATAPAKFFLYPSRFIIGIVYEPVVTGFATELADIVPFKAREQIAALAGPPVLLPAIPIAKPLKYVPTPVRTRNAPNRRHSKIYVADACSGVPHMPSVVKDIASTSW